MLCPRPLNKVPKEEAYIVVNGELRQRRHMSVDWMWRCPCGQLVRPGLGNVVPSHRIPDFRNIQVKRDFPSLVERVKKLPQAYKLQLLYMLQKHRYSLPQ